MAEESCQRSDWAFDDFPNVMDGELSSHEEGDEEDEDASNECENSGKHVIVVGAEDAEFVLEDSKAKTITIIIIDSSYTTAVRKICNNLAKHVTVSTKFLQ